MSTEAVRAERPPSQHARDRDARHRDARNHDEQNQRRRNHYTWAWFALETIALLALIISQFV